MSDVISLTIDKGGKQILVFRGVSKPDVDRITEAMREWWHNDEASVFYIRLNDGQDVELIRTDKDR